MKIFKFYRKYRGDWQLIGERDLSSLSVALGISRILSFVCRTDILFVDDLMRCHVSTFILTNTLTLSYVVGLLHEDLISDADGDDDSEYDYYDVDKEEDVPTNQI